MTAYAFSLLVFFAFIAVDYRGLLGGGGSSFAVAAGGLPFWRSPPQSRFLVRRSLSSSSVAAASSSRNAGEPKRERWKRNKKGGCDDRGSDVVALVAIVPSSSSSRKGAGEKKKNAPYRLGNFAYVDEGAAERRRQQQQQRQPKEGRWRRLSMVLLPGGYQKFLRLLVFLYCCRDAAESIGYDAWEAERDPENFFGSWYMSDEERQALRRRIASASRIRSLVGAGWTPRLVWLYGVMLRGIIHCTALPKIFEPTIGWGAGSVLAGTSSHVFCVFDAAVK